MTKKFSDRFVIQCAIFLMFAGVPAVATADEGEIEVSEKWSVLVTYGDDECPEAEGDEIVVCAQRPESERYRIPKELRKTEEQLAAGHAWTSTVASHDEAARAGRPNSCSVVGSNGFSGCRSAALRQWFAERRLLED